MQIDINTWHYTLSTVAQTLATILGLATVFVVLGLQGLIKNITDYKGRTTSIFNVIKRHVSYDIPSTDTEILQELQKFSINWDSFGAQNSGIRNDISKLVSFYEPYRSADPKNFIDDTLQNLSSFIQQRDKLLGLVKFRAILTAFTILFSILLLTLTKIVCHNDYLLGVIFIFAFLSVIFTLRSSWLILLATE